MATVHLQLSQTAVLLLYLNGGDVGLSQLLHATGPIDRLRCCRWELRDEASVYVHCRPPSTNLSAIKARVRKKHAMLSSSYAVLSRRWRTLGNNEMRLVVRDQAK